MQDLFKNELDDVFLRPIVSQGQSHDAQTGLMNFPAFQEALTGWMHSHPGAEAALLWIDVLNLRREFALWGRRGAETLIGRVADSLRTAVDSSGMVGRYSTRCFLVALKAEAPGGLEKRRIQAILDALSPMRVPGAQGMVEVAAGVAFWPSNTTSLEDLIRFASIAASRAAYVKSRSVLPFRAGMDGHLMRDRQLEIEMLRGMNRNQFRIVYQPTIELATGRILGAEALIRWDHLHWGAVMPSEFIPVAERSDLIHLILNFTLRTALEDARRWEEAGIDLPMIAVNLSWANMRRDDFLSSIRDVLAEHPLARSGIELEITESVLFDDEDLLDLRVRQLKDLGL
ncbi:MAG: EAL domain-containing protein, partial [Acidobacteriota bacterium]